MANQNRDLIEIIRVLADTPAETLNNLTLEKISVYREVKRNIEHYSLQERRMAIPLLDTIINNIATERK